MNRLVVKNDLLPKIKEVQNFINGIQLSRILSTLRYNQIIYTMLEKENNVTVNVKLHNFLIHAASLCEGIRKFRELKSKLKELKSYQENLGEIEKLYTGLDDKNSFLTNVLCRIRNKIVFHFDRSITYEMFEDVVDESIKEKKDIIFASGKTENVIDTTFDLADLSIDLRYILKAVNERTESNADKFKSMVQDLNKLSESFIGILEALMSELIRDYVVQDKDESS